MKRKRITRKLRKLRKYKGGSLPSLKQHAIQWPPMKGCKKEFIPVVFNVGEMFDRFGSVRGTNVSPMFETASRIAKEIGLSEKQPNIYSYTQRALPYIGITNSGFEKNNSRKLLYNYSYKNKQNTDYHTYKVLKPDSVKGGACEVAPAFDTSGGGIQVKLEKNIETLLKEGVIEEIDISNIPPYFPSNSNQKLIHYTI